MKPSRQKQNHLQLDPSPRSPLKPKMPYALPAIAGGIARTLVACVAVFIALAVLVGGLTQHAEPPHPGPADAGGKDNRP